MVMGAVRSQRFAITNSSWEGSKGAENVDAIEEGGRLVERLLAELGVPRLSRTRQVLEQISELRKILSTNYLEDVTLPPRELLCELDKVVSSLILSHYGRAWKNLSNLEILDYLFRRHGPREIQLHTQPYRTGSGLNLRGFFCRAEIAGNPKFVIFVNTAHHPGAVAASLGHELGHYIYDAIKGETTSVMALMEGSLAAHFNSESELFADSLVALSAYSKEMFGEISGGYTDAEQSSGEEALAPLRRVYKLIGSRYGLDLRQLSSALRFRYIASMAHFYKLRAALHYRAGL